MAITAVTTEEADPALRGDRRGYVLGRESVDGFEDRPDLAKSARLALARWGRRFTPEALSDEQRRLLASADMEPREIDEELLSAALVDAEEHVDHAFAIGFYSELTPEQLELVRDPARHPALEGRDYPLSMRDMELLTGASGRQLRYWNSLGLLPAHRISGRRQFMSAAVVRAFALKEAQQHEVAAFAALSRGGPETARFIRMFGAVLGNAAESVTGRGGKELRSAADAMVRHAQELVDHLRTQAEAAARTVAGDDGPAKRGPARYLVHQTEKGWSVRAAGAKRASSRHRTRREALGAARALASKRGGGELQIRSLDGTTSKLPVSGAKTSVRKQPTRRPNTRRPGHARPRQSRKETVGAK